MLQIVGDGGGLVSEKKKSFFSLHNNGPRNCRIFDEVLLYGTREWSKFREKDSLNNVFLLPRSEWKFQIVHVHIMRVHCL